jgi:hypothetical protein
VKAAQKSKCRFFEWVFGSESAGLYRQVKIDYAAPRQGFARLRSAMRAWVFQHLKYIIPFSELDVKRSIAGLAHQRPSSGVHSTAIVPPRGFDKGENHNTRRAPRFISVPSRHLYIRCLR